MKFIQRHHGEKHYPKMKGYLMSCCDCDLVHRVNFEVVLASKERKDGTFDVKPCKGNFRVSITAYRDEKETKKQRKIHGH